MIPLLFFLITPLVANPLVSLDVAAASPYSSDPFLFGGKENYEIEVNNRVLAHVNGKAISVLDVMKKMDMLFLKQFPQYTASPQARFQYYQINWRQVLQELIDKELVLADASESKIPVSSGDVRQEMELLFGPNIIANLDKIGLNFDEAFQIVHGDLLIRRMMMYKVNGKAMRGITPQVIREAYEAFAKKNMQKEAWRYRVITIRNPDSTLGAETAQFCLYLLTEEKLPLDELSKAIKGKGGFSKSNTIISDDLYHTEDDVSEIIRGALKEMQPNSYSKPVAQKSRSDKSTIFRIIFLKEKVPGGAIPYSQIENQLKDELYDAAVTKESELYLKKLRQYHAIHENYIEDMIPNDFQPFILKT